MIGRKYTPPKANHGTMNRNTKPAAPVRRSQPAAKVNQPNPPRPSAGAAPRAAAQWPSAGTAPKAAAQWPSQRQNQGAKASLAGANNKAGAGALARGIGGTAGKAGALAGGIGGAAGKAGLGALAGGIGAAGKASEKNKIVNMPQKQKKPGAPADAVQERKEAVGKGPHRDKVPDFKKGEGKKKNPFGALTSGVAGVAGAMGLGIGKQGASKDGQEKAGQRNQSNEKKKGNGIMGTLAKGMAGAGQSVKDKLTGTLGDVLEKKPTGKKDPAMKGGKAAGKLLGGVVENGPEGVQKLAGKGTNAVKGVGELLGGVFEGGPEVVKNLVGSGAKAVKGAGALLSNVMGKDPAGFKNLIDQGGNKAKGAGELIGNVLEKDPAEFKKSVEKGGKPAAEALGKTLGEEKEGKKGLWDHIKGAAKGAWEGVKEIASDTLGKDKTEDGKKRSWFDRGMDFLGKAVGKGAELVVKGGTALASGATKLVANGAGSVAGMFNSELGENIKSAGNSLSNGIQTVGNGAASFGRDLIHGAIAGDAIENPNAAQMAGMVGVGFIPIVGQIADARDLIGGIAAGDLGRTAGAALGFIPGLGDGLKQAKHLDSVAGVMKHGSKLMDGAKGAGRVVSELAGGIGNKVDNIVDSVKGAGRYVGDLMGGAGRHSNQLAFAGMDGFSDAGRFMNNAGDFANSRKVTMSATNVASEVTEKGMKNAAGEVAEKGMKNAAGEVAEKGVKNAADETAEAVTKGTTVADRSFDPNKPLSPSNYPQIDPDYSVPPVVYEPQTVAEYKRMKKGKGPRTKKTHGDRNIEPHHRDQRSVANGGILDDLEEYTHRRGGNHARHDKPSELTAKQRAKEIRDHYKETASGFEIVDGKLVKKE